MMRAALAVALVAATSSVASAGVYVGLGIGTNGVSDGSDPDRLVEDGRSYRLLVGYQFRPLRRGSIAVEASYDGYGLGLKDGSAVRLMDGRQISLAGRYNLPIADHFEAFGRLGLQHTSASGYSPVYDTSGNGFLIGIGMAYRIDVGVGSGAAITVDYQLNNTSLDGERLKLSLLERQWTLGVAMGF